MEPSQFVAQQRFDTLYITSSEIAKRLEVTRPAIHFRRKSGDLPDAISVSGGSLTVWERDKIEPFLRKWEQELQSKRVKGNNDESAAVGSTSN